MNTNEKGNVGLAMVMADLTKMGYDLFLPFADTTCVDLVISDKNMNLKRVQVKYRKLINGCLKISFSSVVNRKVIKSDLTKTDVWAIYCPDNGNVYYLNSSDFLGKNEVFLRVIEAKVASPNSRNAASYLTLNF